MASPETIVFSKAELLLLWLVEAVVSSSPDVVDCKFIFCSFVIVVDVDIDVVFVCVVIVSKYMREDNCAVVDDDDVDVDDDDDDASDDAVVALAAEIE